MPSKSVSFSDETYVEMLELQPDDMGFSEWVEVLAQKGLEHCDEIEAAPIDNN